MPSFHEPQDCTACARLAEHLATIRRRDPSWHARPVPAFGPLAAELLVVGLGPGEKGANRTGRPFTGDVAGELRCRSGIVYGDVDGDGRADFQIALDGVSSLRESDFIL